MVDEAVDVAVLGATPGGIAAAVRAAREGLETILATDNAHLGGALASGVCVSDTQFEHPRAPLYDEYVAGVREHYRRAYGEDSEEYAKCNDGYLHEPHVAERVLTDLVDAEERVTVIERRHPVSVERSNRRLHSVTLASFEEGDSITVAADTYVDATYEGDLAAEAGVPYRLGRESRTAFGEPHAGRIFTRIEVSSPGYPRDAVAGDLNIRPFSQISRETLTGSTGEGDRAIQSYTSRLTVTDDPDNRRRPEKPDGYDRTRYLGVVEDAEASLGEGYPLKSRVLLQDPGEWDAGIPHAYPLPNDKRDWNATNFVGENFAYPEADPERREEIVRHHHEHSLGLLYFLQHDDAVPDDVQEKAREWGLAADEYPDNDNLPFQLYVREARRIEGRETFTEHDARQAPGLDRTPIQGDSIAIAEWVMDCHDVRPERRRGSAYEGDFFLTEVTRPSQVPYGALLPAGLDDLLVPVALSASHVGFQTIRLEPTWMQIGESAGLAAAVADGTDTTPGTLPVERLQRELVERRSMVSFFNEFDMGESAPWVAAVQYLGTKGFFASYDAAPRADLDRATAERWIDLADALPDAPSDPTEAARTVADVDPAEPFTAGEFAAAVAERLGGTPGSHLSTVDRDPDEALTRGEACVILYDEMAP